MEEIEIYDKGEMVGRALIEFDYSNGALMSVCEIDFLDERRNVLFLADLKYGIVITKAMGDRIREVCNNE